VTLEPAMAFALTERASDFASAVFEATLGRSSTSVTDSRVSPPAPYGVAAGNATIMGGVRFSARSDRTAFVHVLAGVGYDAMYDGLAEGSHDYIPHGFMFLVQPGAGVDLPIRMHAGVRLQADFLLNMRNSSDQKLNHNFFRVSAFWLTRF
jgi:hypothetical protein